MGFVQNMAAWPRCPKPFWVCSAPWKKWMLPFARTVVWWLSERLLNTPSPCCLPPVQEEVWTDAQPQLLELQDSATWVGLGIWVWLRSWEVQLVYGIWASCKLGLSLLALTPCEGGCIVLLLGEESSQWLCWCGFRPLLTYPLFQLCSLNPICFYLWRDSLGDCPMWRAVRCKGESNRVLGDKILC